MTHLPLLLLLAPTSPSASPRADIPAELLAPHVHPLEGTVDEPSGPGWELLLREAAAAQVVALGEQHGLAQVPRFTASLFRSLAADHGYGYLAVENGPWTMARFGAPPLRGERDELLGAVEEHPMCAAFAFLEEVELWATAGRASAAERDPLWGVDQVTGAAPHLAALVDALPPGAARDGVAVLAEEVAGTERRRFEGDASPANLRFSARISQPTSAAALERVTALCSDGLSPESWARVEALVTSNRIYAHNAAGRMYANNHEREELMKRLYSERWRAALARDGRPPRVVIKLGAAQLSRLENVAHVPSLGSHLAALAVAEGGSTFHLAVFGNGGPLPITAGYPTAAALTRHLDPERSAVVDLRPLREPALAGRLGELDPWLEGLLFGYDAVLFLGSPTPITTRWW